MKIKDFTENVHLSTAIGLWSCTAIAVGLLIASWIVPPMGEIHPSVLKGVAEIFGFAAILFAWGAVCEGLGVKIRHNDTDITIDGNEQNK